MTDTRTKSQLAEDQLLALWQNSNTLKPPPSYFRAGNGMRDNQAEISEKIRENRVHTPARPHYTARNQRILDMSREGMRPFEIAAALRTTNGVVIGVLTRARIEGQLR